MGLALSTINMTMWLLNGTLVRTYGLPIGCVYSGEMRVARMRSRDR